MSSPPDDEPTAGSDTGADESTETVSDRPEDAIEPASRRSETTPHRPPAAAPSDYSADQRVEPSHDETISVDSTADTAQAVDSKWWYWVAAVPIYVVAGIVAGVLAALLFVFGIAVDVAGGMGVATGVVAVLLVVGTVGYALLGLALSILFPAGIYLDAKALAATDSSWEPDAVLYLLVAAASVVLSAFTLSAVVAVYYLYRRNQAVGVP